MPKKLNLPLPSADSLFSTQAERDDAKRERVQDIPLTEIDPFPEHPFLVKADESMQAMVESVKAFGVQTPAIVRRKEDGRYELVSGHRRKRACELAGLVSMPCIVRDLTHDEAVIVMVDANLQREVILPSEKARSYKMKLEALKRQGQRLDLTSRPLGEKLSVDQISETAADSSRQIHRYIRLAELISPLLDMVDTGKLALRSAVELSYIPPEMQQLLFEAIESEETVPSHAQTTKLRQLAENKRLNNDVILSILKEEKVVPVEQFKIPSATINRFFAPGTSARTIQETVVKALELWQRTEDTKP